MCEINGQSIFKWMFLTPLAAVDEVKRQKEQRQERKVDTQALSQSVNIKTASEKTASKLKENEAPKRTLSSLRVPLKPINTANTGVNTADTNTGLNIPM